LNVHALESAVMDRIRRLLPVILLVLLPARHSCGHDIPNARVDRSIQATVSPSRLEIDYEVGLSELTLTQDLRMLIGALPGADRSDWFAAYGTEVGPLNARGFLVKVDGEPITLNFVRFELTVEEHPLFRFHFDVKVPRNGRLTIQDTNYASSEGTSRLAIRGRDGVSIRGDDLPPDVDAIPIRPVWQLSNEEERRTRQLVVDYQAPPGPESVAAPAPVASVTESRARPRAGRPGPFGSPQLTRLLDRTAGFPLLGLILLASGLGAVHALQPGHGKTLVAASVLGDRGTWLRGSVVAGLTSLTHTGSVLLVAIGLWWTNSTRYGQVHLGLAHLAGGLVAAIGLWRLGRHLAGYGEHDPDPSVGHEDAGSAPIGGLVGLAMAGGLVPCWDAIVLILVSGATGRLALGIVLLVAFGVGMALVLVAVGAVAGRVRRWVVRDGEAGVRGVWERRLGIASGLALAMIGVYLLGLA
jgi:nickel/cobalt transporter (NicO) family protein